MVSSTSYIARGGDGYEPFANCELVLDEIHAVTMLYLLLKFFKAPDAQQEYASIAMSSSSDNLDDEPMPVLVKKPSVRIGRIKELRSGFRTSKDESRLTCISPVVDGRIKCTTVV